MNDYPFGLRVYPLPVARTDKYAHQGITLIPGGHTLVWRLPNQSDVGYPHYGIHIFQDDRLCFVTKDDPKEPVVIDLIDCREGAATLHHRDSVSFMVDPTQVIEIPAGVAHMPKNTQGLMTVNLAQLRWDRRFFQHRGDDVINIPAAQTENLPIVRPATFPVPEFLKPLLQAKMSKAINGEFSSQYQTLDGNLVEFKAVSS